MSMVTEIIDNEQLHDLWGAGYTITLRSRDPFDIPVHLVPHGVRYQWNPIKPDPMVKEAAVGWTPVPYSRHEGVFAPWGMPGDIEMGGLKLMEKPTEVVDELKRQAKRAAEKQVDDWANMAGNHGISGAVRIGDEERVVGNPEMAKKVLDGTATYERETTKTIETTTAIPRDMMPHIARIFAERDRLKDEIVMPDRSLKPGDVATLFYAAIEADPGAPWWPTLHAILMPIAIQNVRAELQKESRT